MPRISMILGTMLGFVATITATSPVALASPRTGPSSTAVASHQFSKSSCRVLEVTLHGNVRPTIKCYVVATPFSTITPNTVATNCPSANDLKIYQDASQSSSGAIICFTGTGFINMTDYRLNLLQSWNDQASSWSSGKWQGVFYKDISGEGVSQNFPWFETGELNGQNGALPKPTPLSSLKIDGSAPGF